MASTPPPPEGNPVVGPANHVRTLGILIALSTPISGFLLWIVAAVILGEERLEGDSAQTGLGLAFLAAPLVIGAALFLWAHFAAVPPTMTVHSLGTMFIGLGIIVVLLGLFSVLTASDASIGGGVLVLAGLISAATGWAVMRTRPRS